MLCLRGTSLGFCLRIIVKKNPLNLKKTINLMTLGLKVILVISVTADIDKLVVK